MQPTSRVGTAFEGSNSPRGPSGASEPPDVFCGLASLIVEGRIPRNDGRGYGEGPHVPQTASKSLSSRHECCNENNVCKKDENFRKHMLLLWQNNVPVSIEVLLCSNCRVSQQKVRSVEFSTIPEPGSILLEQWTVSIQTKSKSLRGQHLITSHGLFQAVRSYLHFSQLSAWYSSSRGADPRNVLYRITIPGEAFSSKFSCSQPEDHVFPAANVGKSSSVHVSVRSLPRREEIPRITCPHTASTLPELTLSPIASSGASSDASTPSTTTGSPVPEATSSSSETDESKLSLAAALEHPASTASTTNSNGSNLNESGIETDLRKSLVKSRLGQVTECQLTEVRLPRSDSIDSMLGDSLLDPPQSLQKIPPKRYQSPSRCGSPSLEAPDHLLFGSNSNLNSSDSNHQTSSTRCYDNNQSRLARQDLLRRRDINLYTGGLHPRLLHGQQPQISPRLSLFSNQNTPETQPSRTSISGPGPCRAFPASVANNTPQMPSPSSFLQSPCSPPPSYQDSIRYEDSTLENMQNSMLELNLGAKQKKSMTNVKKTSTKANFPVEAVTKLNEPCDSKNKICDKFNNSADSDLHDDRDVLLEEDLDGLEIDGVLPDDELALDYFETSQKSNCSSRRSSLKDEDSLFPHKCKKNKNSTLDDILGIHPESGIFSSDESFNVTRVYRAEIPPLQALQRQQQQQQNTQLPPRPSTGLAVKKSESPSRSRDDNLSKSDILLGAILRTCERNRHLEDSQRRQGLRRRRAESENPSKHYDLLDPLDLDLSFETSKDWSEDDEEEEEEEELQEVQQTSRRSSFSADGHVPTPDECASYRQSFESATSMVFHRRTGLPLTSSPAPLRRGRDKFDFDDSITSPHAIKKALFAKKSASLLMMQEKSSNDHDENKENLMKDLETTVEIKEKPTLQELRTGSNNNKTSPPESIIQTTSNNKRERRPSKKLLSASAPASISNNLLGNFEESVLNGRLEPNSTVEGFTAEIGASGSFQPKHKTLPVTVFFYTLCDNAAYSSPYLGHINLGKKGYRVPPKGTIQVTLFNPLGTVVKMFVVMYDLSDMPPNSQTFLRQRTLYMPSEGVNDAELQKWLRYLVHLRFLSSNSGKIYLQKDIRMIIFRKSDLDTASDYTSSKGFELRSFVQGPNNPKFSPRR